MSILPIAQPASAEPVSIVESGLSKAIQYGSLSALGIVASEHLKDIVQENLVSATTFFTSTFVYGCIAIGYFVVDANASSEGRSPFPRIFVGLGTAGFAAIMPCPLKVMIPLTTFLDRTIVAFSRPKTHLGIGASELIGSSVTVFIGAVAGKGQVPVAAAITSIASLHLGSVLEDQKMNCTNFGKIKWLLISCLAANAVVSISTGVLSGVSSSGTFGSMALTAGGAYAVANLCVLGGAAAGRAICQAADSISHKICQSSCVKSSFAAIGSAFSSCFQRLSSVFG